MRCDQEKNPQLFSKEAKWIEEYVEEGEIGGGGGGGGDLVGCKS